MNEVLAVGVRVHGYAGFVSPWLQAGAFGLGHISCTMVLRSTGCSTTGGDLGGGLDLVGPVGPVSAFIGAGAAVRVLGGQSWGAPILHGGVDFGPRRLVSPRIEVISTRYPVKGQELLVGVGARFALARR